MRRSICSLFLLASGLSAQNLPSISGKVTNSVTGEPIRQVLVGLTGYANPSDLERMGLSHAEHFVHFLEPVSVSGVTAQVVL